jgi:hypothetical protein
MKMNKWIGSKLAAAAVACIGLAVGAAWADNQIDPYTPLTGPITNTCGVYYGCAKMTNGQGSYWITPPTNITVISGTLTDTSGYGPPYSSMTLVGCINGKSWCSNSSSLTFPATNGLKYSMTIVATGTPPPTNGQPISLQVSWQQN